MTKIESHLYPKSSPPLYPKARKAYKTAFPSLKEGYGKKPSRAAIAQHNDQHHLSQCESAGPDESHRGKPYSAYIGGVLLPMLQQLLLRPIFLVPIPHYQCLGNHLLA